MTRKPILAIFGLSFLVSLVIGSYITLKQNQNTLLAEATQQKKPQILGISGGGGGSRPSRQPQMYVYGGENAFGSGGVISMSSTDQPSLSISTYNVTGDAEVTLYRANIDSVLKYLTHDSENKQLNKSVDTSSFELVGTSKHNIQSSSSGSSVLPLPIDGKGIWYVTIKLGNITVDGYIIRSDNGVIAKEGKDKFIFWGQNFNTYRSVSNGNIKIYSLKDRINQLRETTLGSDGMGESEISADADLAIFTTGDDVSILPLNLQFLNIGSGYSQFTKSILRSRYFLFTDRQLYQPGDTVNFKAIIRSDDDARYSVPSGSAKITITTGNNETKFEKSFPISDDGSINGKYELPKDASIGGYNLTVDVGDSKQDYAWGEYSSNNLYFNVQNYQKPESFINVDTPQIEYISGDTAKLQISGSYFSGQPLIGTSLKYKVTAVDYYEYTYYSDKERSQSIDTFYGYWYGTQTVKEGSVELDKNGSAVVDVDTKQLDNPEENSSYTKGQSKIFVVEVTQEDGSLVPSYSRKNFIVYAGEYGIYQSSNTSSGKINQSYKLPLKLGAYFRQATLSGIDLTGKIHRESWVKDIAQSGKYPTYHLEEEDLGEVKMKTGKDGSSSLAFTPSKVGFYKIRVEGRDNLDNYISKMFYAYITDRDMPLYRGPEAPLISLTLDKDKYVPTDKATVSIVSEIADRDVLLTMERGRVDRTQVVHIDGKSKDVEIELKAIDVPNMYLTISVFNNYGLDLAEINVPVSALGKKLAVTIAPDNSKYGPGDNVSINLTTANQDGTPQSAEVALWAVDKAIFELADTNLFNIFDTFWAERGDTTYESHSLMGILTQQAEGGGGCFAPGTLITLGDGSTRAIENIKVGDVITTRKSDNSGLVESKVTGTHSAKVGGYMIINDSLRLTPDHILRLNGLWRTAGDIQVGDKLTGIDGDDIVVASIAWQLGEFSVYNLEIKDYHTFIADGYWVHNQKGDGRVNFKDTAYWNPVIKTGSDGKANIKFKLPDNLTTWTLAAVASTSDSRVGQNTKEIIVTKDLIVRPILPNIMRVGDEIYISALVQNFTDKDYDFQVQLSFDSGVVEQNTWENVKITSMDMEQLDWKISPDKVNDAAKLKITAVATGNSKVSDSIEIQIPVRRFGFLERVGQTAIGDKEYDLKLNKEIDLTQSEVKVSLAPSLFGTLPTVMNYLVSYAYGCVEQTVSRLVPAIIVAENPDLFDASIKDKNLDKIVNKNLTRLQTMQRGDGGWTWWFTGKSDPFITSYATEYITKAESLGYKINGDMLVRAQNYLKQNPAIDEKVPHSELDPDLLSLSVIKNYERGDHNPATNGLKQLISLAQSQGDTYFWAAGSKNRFGSIDASTGMALSAVLTAGGDKEVADKAVLYLTRSRKSDYWGNTYATSRIISALVDYAKLSRDLTPSYDYEVGIDAKKLASGRVTNPLTIIKDIEVPISKLGNDGSTVSVEKTGEGNIYSTLLVSQFLTSTNQKSINRGISIAKRFENVKGSGFDIGVGDTVNVFLTIAGLPSDDKYGVMTDELPSGMVPVNTGLKNEQSSWNIPEDFENGFNITDTEVTENGVVLSLYNVSSEEHTYSYKARVVSAGKFAVPPATVSLMYAPEIYGRSATSVIELKKTYGSKSGQLTSKLILPVKIIAIIATLIIIAVVTMTILKKRKLKKSMIQPTVDQVPESTHLPPNEA